MATKINHKTMHELVNKGWKEAHKFHSLIEEAPNNRLLLSNRTTILTREHLNNLKSGARKILGLFWNHQQSRSMFEKLKFGIVEGSETRMGGTLNWRYFAFVPPKALENKESAFLELLGAFSQAFYGYYLREFGMRPALTIQVYLEHIPKEKREKIANLISHPQLKCIVEKPREAFSHILEMAFKQPETLEKLDRIVWNLAVKSPGAWPYVIIDGKLNTLREIEEFFNWDGLWNVEKKVPSLKDELYLVWLKVKLMVVGTAIAMKHLVRYMVNPKAYTKEYHQ